MSLRRLTLACGFAVMLAMVNAVAAQSSPDDGGPCRSALPAADRALLEARKSGDPRAIIEARAALASALDAAAAACPVVAPVYRAHIAESACAPDAARAAYLEYAADERAEEKSRAAARMKLQELSAWQTAQISVISGSNTPIGTLDLRVHCVSQAADAASNPSCVLESHQSNERVGHWRGAVCTYTAVAPGFVQARGELGTQGSASLVLTAGGVDEQDPSSTTPELRASSAADASPRPELSEKSNQSLHKALLYTSGGLGLVALGTGIAFAVAADAKDRSADHTCPQTRCDDKQAVEQSRSAAELGNIATVGFIVGGVGLACAAVLWLTLDSPEQKPLAAVAFGPGSIQAEVLW